MDKETKCISQEAFDYLVKHEPEFLRSYSILAAFYTKLTSEYEHKRWKDGRIVLTPKSKSNES